MKRWKIILLSILGAAGIGLFWANESGWLLGATRAGLEDGLHQATGREVHVGSVTGGFSGWVWLHDLSMGPALDGRRPDVSVTAQAVGLKLNWAQLVLHRRASLDDLKAVKIKGADAYVLLPKPDASPATLTAQAQDPLAGLRLGLKNAPLPPVLLSLVAGRIWAQRPGERPSLWLEHAEIDALPSPGHISLKGSGLARGGTDLKVLVDSDSELRHAQAQISFKHLGIGILPMPTGLSLSAGTLEGKVQVLAQPGLAGLWPGLQVEGGGKLEGGALRWRERAAVEQVQAQWALKDQALKVSGVQAVAAEGKWKGEASLDLAAQTLQAKLSSPGLSLQALGPWISAPEGLSLTGAVSADFEAAGPVSATVMSLALQSKEAQWRGQALSNFDLRWDRSGNGGQNLQGHMTWDQGQANADASWDAHGGQRGSVDMDGVQAGWLEPWLGATMNGRLKAKGHWQGSAQGLTWEAQASSGQMQVGSMALDKMEIQGWGNAKALHARVAGDALGWNGINAQLDARRNTGGAWALKATKIFVGDKLLATAEGQGLPNATGRWDGDWKVKAGPWPAADLPWLRSFKGLSGTVQAQGGLHLADSRLDWQGVIDAPQLARGASSGALHAKIAGQPGSISVTALTLRRGEVAGELHWLDGRGWDADLQLAGANLPALAELGDAGFAVSGTASGSLQWQQTPGQPRGQGDLELKALGLGAFQADTASLQGSFEGGRWVLKQWSARQSGGGQWTAAGSLDLNGRDTWTGKSDWQAWRMGTAVWEGRAALSGGSAAEGQLTASSLRLDGKAQPDLHASAHVAEQRLQDWRLTWGEGLQAQGHRSSSGWDGELKLENQDPGLILGAWSGQSLQLGLPLSGTLKVQGLGGPEANGTLDLSGFSPSVGGATAGVVSGHWKKLAAEARWQGRIDWTTVDLKHMQQGLQAAGIGLPLDVAGSSTGHVDASAAGISFSAQLETLSLEGVDFGLGRVAGTWDHGVLHMDTASLGNSGPRLDLQAASFTQAQGAWTAEADLEARDFPYSLFTLGGKGRLKASGHGSEGSLASDWAWAEVGTRRFEALGLNLQWKDGAWTLAPKLGKQFKASGKLSHGDFMLASVDSQDGAGSAHLTGSVMHDGAVSFDGQATGYPAGNLTGCLGWAQDWRGAAYGSLSVRGSTSTVRTIVSVKIENGSVQGLAFDLAQATVHIENGWVKLAPLGPIKISRREAYDLEVDGDVPLSDSSGKQSGPMDVKAHLVDGGLGFLASLPGVKAADGPMDLNLHFSGDRSDPAINGTFKITDGTVTPAWMLPPLEKVNLLVQIQQGQVLLQHAQARVTGDGPLLLLELADKDHPAFVLDHWVPQHFNLRLRASASGLPVRSTPQLHFVDGTLHPDLVLQGDWDSPAVSGQLNLDRGSLDKALVVWPPRFDPPLAEPKEGDEPSFLDRVDWDLGLSGRKDVMLRSDVAQVFVDTGDKGLRLRGVAPHRLLEGRLTALKGSVDYLLASFDIAADRPTFVDFLGEDSPQLEMWGTRTVRDVYVNGQTAKRDVVVRMHAYGPLGKVQMDLTDDSGDDTLTSNQLASLAGLGLDSSDPRNQGGFARLLGKAPATMLNRMVRGNRFVDEIGVRLPVVEDALAGNQGETSTADSTGSGVSPTAKPLVEVSAGKWLSNKLFLGVDTLFSEKGSSVDPSVGGKLEYQLKNDARISAQHNIDTEGQAEQRVMLERSSSFENYNARKRRWGQADATPVPSPVVTAAATSSPPSSLAEPPGHPDDSLKTPVK